MRKFVKDADNRNMAKNMIAYRRSMLTCREKLAWLRKKSLKNLKTTGIWIHKK